MEEKRELKYPIKYVVMPIEEQIGWAPGINESEREYDVVANIVTKCYVIGEHKKYRSDGTIKIEYEIVFPYSNEDIICNARLKRVTPKFNFHSQCINSFGVDDVYNSFEEASAVANKENNRIIASEVGIIPFDESFQEAYNEVRDKHQKTIARYKKIEEQIERETTDMLVTSDQDLSYLIEQIIENPSEFYIKLANVLTVEEREYLKQLIENRSCSNCTNGSCRVEQSEKVGLDEEGKPQGSNCLSWNNSELIGRQRILRKE